MGDNKKYWLWISLGIVAGVLVLGYIGTALYFMSHFLPNTKVNGKDFSYAKEEDVADYLKSYFSDTGYMHCPHKSARPED